MSKRHRIPKKAQGFIAINIAAVLFGSAALYGKLNVSPVWIVAMRSFFAFCALAILGKWQGHLAWPKKELLTSIFLTGAILCGHWLTFFASVQLAGVAIATLTFAAFPLFTILIETFKNKRPPHLIEIGAGLAILAAVNLLVDLNVGKGNEAYGALAGLASALSFAIFGVFSKKLTNKIPAMMLSLLQNAGVFILLFPFLPFAQPAPNHFSDFMYLLSLGVVTTALMHQLYLFALKRLSAATCSGFVALEPIYAILFAFYFFGESISWIVAVSSTLIFSASLLLLSRETLASKNISPQHQHPNH